MNDETKKAIKVIADLRKEAIERADQQRSTAVAKANQEFADGVKLFVVSGEATVGEISRIVKLDRTRVYQVIRSYATPTVNG